MAKPEELIRSLVSSKTDSDMQIFQKAYVRLWIETFSAIVVFEISPALGLAALILAANELRVLGKHRNPTSS